MLLVEDDLLTEEEDALFRQYTALGDSDLNSSDWDPRRAGPVFLQ